MLRSARVFGVLGLVAAVCLVGCPSKDDGSSQADAGQVVAKAPVKPTIEGVPEGFIDPLTASQKIHDPIKFNKKISQMAEDLDPKDAPEYAQKMVAHLKKVAEVIDANLADCDKVQDALEAYFKEHKEEIVRQHKEGSEQEAKMDESQRAKVQTQTMLLMGPIAETLAKTLARFQVKCPEQAQEVADLLQAVVGR